MSSAKLNETFFAPKAKQFELLCSLVKTASATLVTKLHLTPLTLLATIETPIPVVQITIA